MHPLVHASVAFFNVDITQAQRLETLVFNGYMEGLHGIGWQGDPRYARLGYAASCIRYFLGGITPVLTMILDKNRHSRVEQAFQCTIEELLDHWGQGQQILAHIANEARQLIECLY